MRDPWGEYVHVAIHRWTGRDRRELSAPLSLNLCEQLNLFDPYAVIIIVTREELDLNDPTWREISVEPAYGSITDWRR